MMKKSAIALAVAAALGSTAASAATTLYGSARLAVDIVNDGDDTSAQVVSNSSRLGVKGSEDLGNGTTVIYQYEFGVDPTDDSGVRGANWNSDRPRFLGLSAGWGTLTAGSQFTPEYDILGITDVFNGSGSWFQSNASVRQGKSLKYVSPSFGGFSAHGMVTMDGYNGGDDEANKKYVDEWNLAGRWASGPFSIGATYYQAESEYSAGDKGKRWGIALGYSADVIGAAFTWERGNFGGDDLGGDNNLLYSSVYTGVVEYTMGNSLIRGQLAYEDFSSDVDISVWYGALGFQHKLSNRTRVWAEGYVENVDADDVDTDNQYLFSIGMRHDF
jgi:predicted porin